ncbi:hypothetical protein ABEB36_002412 [Hypothenemus hampei]|uniref:Uncharacterized protein n=1 Tax=Hypothenemus hampei TaxID=57062 RepID=A0ABD1F9C0_HYPHA
MSLSELSFEALKDFRWFYKTSVLPSHIAHEVPPDALFTARKKFRFIFDLPTIDCSNYREKVSFDRSDYPVVPLQPNVPGSVYAGIRNVWIPIGYLIISVIQTVHLGMQLIFMIIVVLEIGNKVIETRKYLKSRPEDIDSHKKSFSIVYEGIEIFGELFGYQFLTMSCGFIIYFLALLMFLIEVVKPLGMLTSPEHIKIVIVMGIVVTLSSNSYPVRFSYFNVRGYAQLKLTSKKLCSFLK